MIGRPVRLSNRNVRWTVLGGAICLVFLFLIALFRSNENFETRSSPAVNPSPIENNTPHQDTGTRLDQDFASPSEQSKREEHQYSPPPALEGTPPPIDAATRQKIVAGLKARLRDATKNLFGDFFQQLHLSADLQEKVMDILTQSLRQSEQQAFESMQSGEFVQPPSPEAMQAQQARQDQQLRSLLGDAGFAAFSEYRGTIPDRVIINDLNQQGANLSESQSTQLLQILKQARQQITGQTVTQNLNSMPPDKAMSVMQQQEDLLWQTVSNRTQNLLSPEQVAALQGVFSHYSMSPKGGTSPKGQ
jgi:hypothetical protein